MSHNNEHILSNVTIDTATGRFAPADVSTDRVRSIFSNISQRYERFNLVSSFGTYKLWLKKLCNVADIDADDDVLDIAGGTGEVTFHVAKGLHPAHIQCTDLVPEMLDVARDHYAEGDSAGVPVDFEVVDAHSIPYEDETYDAITMAYGLRNMPDRARALSEMHRVLKPGGSITCLDFSTPPNRAWRKAYGLYLRYLIPFWGKMITGEMDGFKYLTDSIKAFPDQEGVAKMFRDAGFVDVSYYDLTGGIAAIHTARKPLSDG